MSIEHVYSNWEFSFSYLLKKKKLFLWHILRVQKVWEKKMFFSSWHLENSTYVDVFLWHLFNFFCLILNNVVSMHENGPPLNEKSLHFVEKENIIQIFHWDLKQDMNFNRMTAFGYKLAQWIYIRSALLSFSLKDDTQYLFLSHFT